jgi:histidyl-tRNA synthetase
MQQIKAIRGMHDILPNEISLWQYFECVTKNIFSKIGYKEIRLPIVEKKSLFYTAVGTSTDIVEKETYDLWDRNNESLSLRPEGTSSCVRSVIEHNLLRRNIKKIWYTGPMFRYEKPQKGRYRQFHQLGIELYGNYHITQDAELLGLIWRIWKNLKIEKNVVLEINNLGTQKEKDKYKKYLINYLKPLESKLDQYSKKKITH